MLQVVHHFIELHLMVQWPQRFLSIKSRSMCSFLG
jgi:hypothetical protein